jgi:imidazolonepropionase-like amidohydrolase
MRRSFSRQKLKSYPLVFEFWFHRIGYNGDQEHFLGDWRLGCDFGKRITRESHKVGVLIDAGSDSDQETFVQHEMKLLVNECGFSPLEAIIAATKYSAMATGIFKQEGSIEAGKKANLVLLNSDPTKNSKDLEDVLLVIKNGKLYNPE